MLHLFLLSFLATDPFENSPWKQFLLEDEKIVFTGVVSKKKSMFSLERKRQLILTSLPRFVYVDPDTMQYKKDISWEDIRSRLIDDMTFTIETPRRTYVMKGQTTGARAWVAEIEKMAAKMKEEAIRISMSRGPLPTR